MMKLLQRFKGHVLFILLFSFLLIFFYHPVQADNTYTENTNCSSISDPDQQMACWDAQVSIYNQRISQDQNQVKTLQTQIDYIDNQIKLTTTQIAETKYQIAELNQEISDLDQRINRIAGNVDTLSAALMQRMVETYKYGNVSILDLLFSSQGFDQLIERFKYIQIIQENDQQTLYQLQATKADYHDQKQDRETRQAEEKAAENKLNQYQTQLADEKTSKQDLLTETQGNEANYEKLLSVAQAQLASLSQFARSASGGVEIIPHEDLSDSWGKYYNQRDANWGNNFIGNSSERIWDVGCLMTSYAMVVTHYGGSLTPADVAANTGNFALGTAYFNIPGPTANSHSAEYVTNPTLQQLRDALNAGNAVIAGMSMNGGPYPQHYSDHWVVLRSVDGDSFRINDPEYQGAMNVSLNDHYSSWTIIEARIYH